MQNLNVEHLRDGDAAASLAVSRYHHHAQEGMHKSLGSITVNVVRRYT